MLPLAQTIEVAEKGLSLLERVQAGGVPLICLVMLALALIALYKVVKDNAALREAATARAEEGTKQVEVRAAERAGAEAALYREMMANDRESHETQVALKNAFEGFTVTLKDQRATCEESNRAIRVLSTRMDDLTRSCDIRGGPRP